VTATDLPGPRWALTLYVSGASPRSAEAIVTVRRICDEDLAGQVDLTVLNAIDHPARVKEDHILALPTLVKHSPAPLRHLVGNLTDVERVRSALDLDLATPAPPSTLTASAEGAETE
jgi:circadian clock protein KaiB